MHHVVSVQITCNKYSKYCLILFYILKYLLNNGIGVSRKKDNTYISDVSNRYAVLPLLNVPKFTTPWAAIGSVVLMILHFWNQCMQPTTLSQLYNKEHPDSRHNLCVFLWGLWMGWSLFGIRYAGGGSNLRSRWNDLTAVTAYYVTVTNKYIMNMNVWNRLSWFAFGILTFLP